MDIEKRKRMAVESLLENESLRDGLDDESASALLEWGSACAKRIAEATASLEDDDEADEIIYPRMRALRDMLRSVQKLYSKNVSVLQRGSVLKEIAEKLPQVYGDGIPAPEIFRWNIFAILQSGSLGQKINGLRALIETHPKAK
ncbi:MAG: hypothetical protein EHM81_11855 [Chloroflexi bacterium]|nr:MAG: hypothetical protein EHM81_11855 [Chloroflexota bacterium]